MAVIIAVAPGIASGAYTPTVSDIDPEILKLDESKYLGAKIGPDVMLVDEKGSEFAMGDFTDKSAVLVLSYYTCDGACPAFNAELAGLMEEAEALGRVRIGEDVKIITISFDKNDNAMTAAHFKKNMGLSEHLAKNWTFATFKNHEDISKFTTKIGFNFFWSPQDRMFYHPNAFIFLSPEGRIVRVMHSSNIEPKDMELAIIDTNFNRLQPSQVIAIAVGLCYSYNYKEGKYSLNYPLFIAIGALFVGIGAFAYGALKVKKRVKSKEMTV